MFSKKSLIITGIVTILILAGIGWFWYGKSPEKLEQGNVTNQSIEQETVQIAEPEVQQQEEVNKESEQKQEAKTPSTTGQKLRTTVDPDTRRWQTKETEYFTIKFPNGWYWMESNLETTGYHSQVITNNPNFDINKYADIGMFTGGEYPLILGNGQEVVITTNGLGGVTSNAGAPKDFMDGEISRLKDLYPKTECRYTSSLDSIPLTAFCSLTDSNGQMALTYYTSHPKRTFAYTARFYPGNSLEKNMEHILENIAKSLVQKWDF